MTPLEPLVRRARNGEPTAIMKIMRIYTPMMKRYSTIDGAYSEECMQEIRARVLHAILVYPME